MTDSQKLDFLLQKINQIDKLKEEVDKLKKKSA